MAETWKHIKLSYKRLFIVNITQDILEDHFIDYLENREDAIIRLENIALEEKMSSDEKRKTFGAQFTMINDIYFLIEQVGDTTNT